MSTVLHAITYFQDHEELLGVTLDEMVEVARPQPDDIPAFTFATLVAALEKDPSRTVTTAALALMRLGEMKNAAEGRADA